MNESQSLLSRLLPVLVTGVKLLAMGLAALAMTTAMATLDGMNVAAPLDALGDLAAAAGYEARGAHAEAEFYLGLGLGLAKLGDAPVTPASVAGLLRLIYSLALGTEPMQPGGEE